MLEPFTFVNGGVFNYIILKISQSIYTSHHTRATKDLNDREKTDNTKPNPIGLAHTKTKDKRSRQT